MHVVLWLHHLTMLVVEDFQLRYIIGHTEWLLPQKHVFDYLLLSNCPARKTQSVISSPYIRLRNWIHQMIRLHCQDDLLIKWKHMMSKILPNSDWSMSPMINTLWPLHFCIRMLQYSIYLHIVLKPDKELTVQQPPVKGDRLLTKRERGPTGTEKERGRGKKRGSKVVIIYYKRYRPVIPTLWLHKELSWMFPHITWYPHGCRCTCAQKHCTHW